MLSFNWCSTFLQYDIDSAVNTLLDALHKSVIDYVPKCCFRETSYPSRFLSPEPNLNMNLRNDIKIILNVQRKSLKNNPYNFWKFVTKKRFNNNISKVMTTSDTITSNLHETANLFSDYFSSVYSTDRIDLESRCHLSQLCDVWSIGPDGLALAGSSLGLSLNRSKCQVFTFGRIKSPFIFPYCLGENNIPGVSDYAFKSLGFVMRLSKDFQLGILFKTLYCALVRPILEYGSVVWDPHTANNSRHLERVQHRFLRFATERRHTAGIRFIEGLLNGKVESSAILTLICFKVPQSSTRSSTPFYVLHSTTNYIANEPLRRLMSNANADTNFTFC
ncbi:Uncharacterized protein FWK35_00032628, partial [Aphis craccivora]